MYSSATNTRTITGRLHASDETKESLKDTLNRRLLILWDDMERTLEDVPLIENLYTGQSSRAEYDALLGALQGALKGVEGELQQLRTTPAPCSNRGPVPVDSDHAAPGDGTANTLGARFITDGLYGYLAPHWASLLPAALHTKNTRFFEEHKTRSTKHWTRLDATLEHVSLTDALVEEIMKSAQSTVKTVCRYLTEAGAAL